MRERIVIVFVAIAIGLIVTTLVFFLYQQTKTLPDTIARSGQDGKQNEKAEEIENNVSLIVEEPLDESLSDRRKIEVKGSTDVGNTVVISTNQEDVIATPTNDGDFSISIDIDSGTNKVLVRAIAPNGDSREIVKIVTFNTEEF